MAEVPHAQQSSGHEPRSSRPAPPASPGEPPCEYARQLAGRPVRPAGVPTAPPDAAGGETAAGGGGGAAVVLAESAGRAGPGVGPLPHGAVLGAVPAEASPRAGGPAPVPGASGAGGAGRTDTEAPGAETPPAQRWELLLPHQERLQRLARLRLTGHQDAEDCVQEALLRAAVYRDLDEERVGPFLTSITLRLCVDVHRRRERARRFLHQHSLVPETAVGPEEAACSAAEGAWMLQQVQRLDGREREVVLARIEGTSTREAAGRLGISFKTAEGAFTRARARLRRWHGASLSA